MWKLTIEDDEGQQTSLSLAVDEYRLGRAETNTIRLTDRNVSRSHAVLKKNGQGWVVKDLRSYNGTYVNGVRVGDEQPIVNGDIVQLGDYRLELIDESLLAPSLQGAAAPPTSALPPVHLRPNRLVVIVGPQPGAEFPLNAEKMTIGRSEDATISINHSSVSRVHAELCALGNGRFEIIDKGSANGIRVNGVDLRRGILEAGDALELGDVRMRFVGAGKIFRAGIDASQRLGGGFSGTGGKTSGVSLSKLIGIGAVVGVVLIGAVIALWPSSGPGTQTEAHVPASDADAKILKEATVLMDSGNLEGAHQKVLEIPENSSARDDEAFLKVEGKWADSIFEKVAKSTDNAEKKALLNLIISTPSVDAERRKKAADQSSAITASEPTAKPPSVPYPSGGQQGSDTGTTGPSAPATTASATASTTPRTVGGPPDEAAMRRQLEGKVWGGKGSLEDVRLLKAICSHMGDRACRDRAGALLKQMQEKQKGN